MKKIFSVFFTLLFCAASVFAASATKNIHILIDTGKSMRDDGISKKIYQSVGGYVARFIDEHHNDKFGKNVNIVVEGVVKHKNGPLLLTVPYVNRKPGSHLDLSAIREMNPNPPDWMTSWDLDPNPTNLDLFQTFFFDKAKDTVFVVISNSDVGKKSFFGKRPSVIIQPQAFNIHKADYPNNVRVFLVNIPGTGSSGERLFKPQTIKERVNAGMEAAWKSTVYEPPQAALSFDFTQNGELVKSYNLTKDMGSKPVFGVYAPAVLKLNAQNAFAVERINISGSAGINNTECDMTGGKKCCKDIANLKTRGIYTVKAEVIGQNGDSYTHSFSFEVFAPLIFDVKAKAKSDAEINKQVIKGKAPLVINFAVRVSNADGEPEWYRNGKKFNPDTDNVFNADAKVECRVKGLDGRVYTKSFEVKIVAPAELKFSAKANNIELIAGKTVKIEGEKTVLVTFSSNKDKKVRWERNGRRFAPGTQAVRFDKSEKVKCIYTDNGKQIEYAVDIVVTIPPPEDPFISGTADGVALANHPNEAKLVVESGKVINFVLEKENVTKVMYLRNGRVFNKNDKITENCVIEVHACNETGKSVSKYITVEIPVKLAKLTANANGKMRDANFLDVKTKSDNVEVSLGFDIAVQLDELQKYQISYDGKAKESLPSYSWKKSFAADKPHIVKLYYNDKECDKFTIRIEKGAEETAKLVVDANGQKRANGYLNVKTNDKDVTVKFAFDKALQVEEIKNKYSVSYGDKPAAALDRNEWEHKFEAGKAYQIKLFFNGKVCDKFTLNVKREYKLSFDAVIADENKSPKQEEDGSRSLAFTSGQTVTFTVKGIAPKTDLADLNFQIIDSSESVMFNSDLAALKAALEEERKQKIADGEENVKEVQPDSSVFTWVKDDLGVGSYTAILKNTKTNFEDKVTLSVQNTPPPPDFPWGWVIIGLLVVGGGVFWFIKTHSVKIDVQEEDNKPMSIKVGNGTIELDKKFRSAPELKITIEGNKIIVHEKDGVSVEYGIGKEPLSKMFFENGKGSARFSSGANKAVTLVVKQYSTTYKVTISK